MVSLNTLQKKLDKRLKNRRSRKMLQICLSPKKAKEDVDLIGYKFEGKKKSIQCRAYSQRNNRQSKNHL